MKFKYTGPLTKESRMFSNTKATRDKGDQKINAKTNWVILCHIFQNYKTNPSPMKLIRSCYNKNNKTTNTVFISMFISSCYQMASVNITARIPSIMLCDLFVRDINLL